MPGQVMGAYGGAPDNNQPPQVSPAMDKEDCGCGGPGPGFGGQPGYGMGMPGQFGGMPGQFGQGQFGGMPGQFGGMPGGQGQFGGMPGQFGQSDQFAMPRFDEEEED